MRIEIVWGGRKEGEGTERFFFLLPRKRKGRPPWRYLLRPDWKSAHSAEGGKRRGQVEDRAFPRIARKGEFVNRACGRMKQKKRRRIGGGGGGKKRTKGRRRKDNEGSIRPLTTKRRG